MVLKSGEYLERGFKVKTLVFSLFSFYFLFYLLIELFFNFDHSFIFVKVFFGWFLLSICMFILFLLHVALV